MTPRSKNFPESGKTAEPPGSLPSSTRRGIVKRWTKLAGTLLATATLALSGCGDSDGDNASGECTSENARELTQAFITSSKFDVDCAKAKVGTPFYFVNNDDTTHTVTAGPTSPEVFDAELPKKTSTYSHTFTKPGTYTITCKRHNEDMTLILE
jgi:plastocyanin